MLLDMIHGVIARRVLLNFRIDPEVMAHSLPPPFRPKLYKGYAVGGVCMIRFQHLRPRFVPQWLGTTSENAAHRVAVEWKDAAGELQEGVFIPRRDTGSLLNQLAGGRIFPGEHHAAQFTVSDENGKIDFRMRADDGSVEVKLLAEDAESLPPTSAFDSLADASAFFEKGSLGFSVTRDAGRLDGLRLRTLDWRIQPLAVKEVYSSYYMDATTFPGVP